MLNVRFDEGLTDYREAGAFVETQRRDLRVQIHALEALLLGNLQQHFQDAFADGVTAPFCEYSHASDFARSIEAACPYRSAIIRDCEHLGAVRVGTVPFLFFTNALL
jgi:hypothetical protein